MALLAKTIRFFESVSTSVSPHCHLQGIPSQVRIQTFSHVTLYTSYPLAFTALPFPFTSDRTTCVSPIHIIPFLNHSCLPSLLNPELIGSTENSLLFALFLSNARSFASSRFHRGETYDRATHVEGSRRSELNRGLRDRTGVEEGVGEGGVNQGDKRRWVSGAHLATRRSARM